MQKRYTHIHIKHTQKKIQTQTNNTKQTFFGSWDASFWVLKTWLGLSKYVSLYNNGVRVVYIYTVSVFLQEWEKLPHYITDKNLELKIKYVHIDKI